MQMPERPSDGESPNDGAPSYEWLDEWLCEYVDGTMDPSLEAVFEQYVEADPELKAHVERLRQTRELLRGCDAPDAPTAPAREDLPCEVEEDLFRAPTALPDGLLGRTTPTVAAGLVSSIAVALVVGFLAGSMFVDRSSRSPVASATTIEDQDAPSRATTRGAAPPRRPDRSPEARSPSFPAGDALLLRPATVPTLDADTAGAASAFATAGD